MQQEAVVDIVFIQKYMHWKIDMLIEELTFNFYSVLLFIW